MRTRSQSGDLTQQAPWRQVLGMGEKLIRLARQAFAIEPAAPSTEAVTSTAVADIQQILASLASQHELIASTAERLLNGTARLWIPETVVRGYVGQAAQAAALGVDPSALMRSALEKCQVCGGQDAGGQDAGHQPLLALAVPLIVSEAVSFTAAVPYTAALLFTANGLAGLPNHDYNCTLLQAVFPIP